MSHSPRCNILITCFIWPTDRNPKIFCFPVTKTSKYEIWEAGTREMLLLTYNMNLSSYLSIYLDELRLKQSVNQSCYVFHRWTDTCCTETMTPSQQVKGHREAQTLASFWTVQTDRSNTSASFLFSEHK